MKLRTIAAHRMEPPAKPFLKWAGAKRQLVRTLLELMPAGGQRYIEPFVGSGAVFLNTPYPRSLLSDSNGDIISLYSVLKAKREEFIGDCKRLFTAKNNTAGKYYELRHEFNGTKEPERRAALFVYLNRHCFNGLCRYNKKGEFNTPFGRYDPVPYFPASEMLAFAEKLQKARLRTMDFREAILEAGRGDVVYCDPPYEPLTATANFTNYAAGGFSQQDQRDLHARALEASARGAFVVISNHDTEFTQSLYKGASRLEEVMVSRTISCNGQNRTKAKELIAVFGDLKKSEQLL